MGGSSGQPSIAEGIASFAREEHYDDLCKPTGRMGAGDQVFALPVIDETRWMAEEDGRSPHQPLYWRENLEALRR